MTLRDPRTALAALLAALSMSCGGAEVDPFQGATPTMVSLPPVSLTMIPSVGEHVFEWGPEHPSLEIRPPLSWTADFTAPEDVAELWVRVRLLSADGQACLVSSARVGRVVRGNRYVASGDRYEMPDIGPWYSLCSDRFHTVEVDVNLTAGPPAAAGEAAVVRGFVFEHFYYFERTGFSPTGAPS